MSIIVDIRDTSRQIEITSTRLSRLTENVIRTVLQELRMPHGEVSVMFVSSRKIRSLNQQYLGRNLATDVIAFPMEQSSPLKHQPPLLGDIVISFERARIQAREADHSLEQEITLLLIHGLLHLMGFDDTKPSTRKKMIAQQEHCLSLVKQHVIGCGEV